MKNSDMSFVMYRSGEYAVTLFASRVNIKTYMIRKEDRYLYAVRTDGQRFHCHIKNGKLYMTKDDRETEQRNA